MKIGAPINGDTSIDHHCTTTKSGIFVRERRIVSSATITPDKKYVYYQDEEKNKLVGKKNIASFISSPVHMLCRPLPAISTVIFC